jgi:hypothetical protein
MAGFSALYYAAAAATAIAGMLHLMLGPSNLNFNVNQGILFIVGGAAQVFWIIPVIRRWGAPWYAAGMGGTAVFMALWIITRMPDNPITGRAGPATNAVAITIEVMQSAFIGLAAAILVYESRKGRTEKDTGLKPAPHRQKTAILAGVVVALVLIGALALPAAMPRPSGPPQGQGGPQGPGQNQTSRTDAAEDLAQVLMPVAYLKI